MNQATSFIDASQLYGHTVDTAASIRTFTGGRLKTDIINGHQFCPQKQRYRSLLCDERDYVGVCFEAGNVLQSLLRVKITVIFISFELFIIIY